MEKKYLVAMSLEAAFENREFTVHKSHEEAVAAACENAISTRHPYRVYEIREIGQSQKPESEFVFHGAKDAVRAA